MPTITSLIIYPIKSCAGIALTEAIVTPAGLRYAEVSDREWMVVDSAGQFLTQREIPQMALIVPSLHSDGLRVTAPGMRTLNVSHTVVDSGVPATLPMPTSLTVTVWDDSLSAQDCGDDIADWFSEAVGIPCRLVHFDPAIKRLASKKWTGGREVPTLFSDGYPILLISQASLDDLNQKLRITGRDALPMNRFRPNIVIDGVEPFEEDFVETFSIEKIRLQPVKPCPRCPIPSVDQATGKPGPDPVEILQTYRANPKVDGGITFGMNTILLDGEGEMLRIGQEIEIELAF